MDSGRQAVGDFLDVKRILLMNSLLTFSQTVRPPDDLSQLMG